VFSLQGKEASKPAGTLIGSSF